MSPEIAIIADDLTGAGDTAVQFRQEGWAAELRLRGGIGEAGVVAVTTDSRACADAEAAARVRAAAKELREAGATRFFKKVDSTLRGPIRAEIAALLAELPAGTVAVVCPAFPQTGRTVVDGTLLVDGTPVSETAVGRDPVTPVAESHVPTLLGAPLVRLDPLASPAAWAEQVRDNGPVVVLDAAGDDELDRVARTVAELGETALPVGSAGLAAPLARLWRPTRSAGTALVIVTSLHTAARDQAGALAEHTGNRHEPSQEQLLDDTAWDTFVAGVLATAATQPPALLISAPERDVAAVSPELVARRLADVAARVLRAGEIAGVVVTGGDGARALLATLEGTGIRLESNVAPGVALGTVVGGWAAGLPIATKAGGFGDQDVLIKAAHAVREKRSAP
ncbi:four-carbon acid sugar kinase family protein [Saccharomonospora sp. NPDC046836]|uniref:four-carbon acid sugar kinase family protein n=1 Tax=Saccharomonospora sp. NPDC046836 TaxID=3156921 RepID=UPI0033E86231